MRAIYLPAGRNVWINVASCLKDNHVDIRVWLGDPAHDEQAKIMFPDCHVEDFFMANKGVLKGRTSKYTPCKGVLSDPRFFTLKDKVYKMMDRQDDERIFGRLEREALFYNLFNYYYDLVRDENINVLIASEAPHSSVGMVIYGICEILEIPRYHLVASGVAPLLHVAKDFYGTTIDVERNDNDMMSIYKPVVSEYVNSFINTPEEPGYMVNQKKYDDKKSKNSVLKFFELLGKGVRYSKKKRLKTTYTINKKFFKDDNSRGILAQINVDAIHSRLENAYMSKVTPVSLDVDYVFYPLHYEPERTSNPDGGHYYQVYDALVALRSFVPLSVPIYVKEHYSQFTRMLPGHRGKSPYLYDVLSDLPNVHLIDPRMNSVQLVKQALLTVSQTGTACLEAACYEKKSIIMGDTWFFGTPNVYRFDDLESFEELLSYKARSRQEVVESLFTWMDNKAIPGCVNPSGERYFRTKFGGEKYAPMFDDYQMAKQYVDTILKDIKQSS
ncbi:hypothetical protein AB4283_10315 [Vibrio splendidus]|uniref:hypothetical protein n=2 Tax=Vibrio splendidus TaxID=29497 RepID=UPI00354DF1B0